MCDWQHLFVAFLAQYLLLTRTDLTGVKLLTGVCLLTFNTRVLIFKYDDYKDKIGGIL